MESHKVRRHRNHNHRNRQFLSNLYFFACGAIGTFIGNRDLNPNNIFADFKQCIPPEWLQAAGIKTNDEAEPFTYLEDGQSTFRSILNWSVELPVLGQITVDKIIETICKYVDPIVSALGRRRFRRAFLKKPTTKTIARQLYKYVKWGKYALGRRVFLQVKRRWSLGGLWNSVKSGVSSAVNTVSNAAKSVYNAVKSGWNSVTDFISTGASKLVANYIKPFLTKIQSWINSFMEKVQIAIKIYQALMCLKEKATSLIDSAKKAVTGLITAFTKLKSGWAGFVQIIVKTICQWGTLKQAILDLIDSFSNQGTTKWNLIGKFVGGLLAAMSQAFQ
jgi:hypothetical protein